VNTQITQMFQKSNLQTVVFFLVLLRFCISSPETTSGKADCSSPYLPRLRFSHPEPLDEYKHCKME
jgi:hypothetical protein